MTQGIDDAEEYFDPNRILKIMDRLGAPDEVGPIFKEVLRKLNKASRDTVPSEMIRSSNTMLLELSKVPKASKQDFQDLVEQLRSMNYLIQMQI